ncbi:MAG: hypothetical protein SH809_08425 [Rhodothermales bacterium]|nr:hypothetical protein [Rhodothermales bacterium]
MPNSNVSGIRPQPVDQNVLEVYRMMPTSDIERLLEHIEWLESELDDARNVQTTTDKKLVYLMNLLSQHKRAVQAELDRFGR